MFGNDDSSVLEFWGTGGFRVSSSGRWDLGLWGSGVLGFRVSGLGLTVFADHRKPVMKPFTPTPFLAAQKHLRPTAVVL